MQTAVEPASAADRRGILFYAPAIFAGAFLLFLLQPMLAKAILPWFGGAAGVWAVAMCFFQGVLVLGYLYAYLVARFLEPRVQAVLHLCLLTASLALLPVTPSPAWKPAGLEEPAMRILGLLAATAGLPYFLLSTTGPLMQAWFARSRRVAFPYRLFALSNLGSLLALLAYPFLVEPAISTRQQLLGWSWAFAGFVVLCAVSALDFALRGALSDSPGDLEKPGRVEWTQHLAWGTFSACGSALLLAVTNHLTQNVAPMPLLWVVPLAVYLVTFILAFDHPAWYRPRLLAWIFPPLLCGMAYEVYSASAIMPPRAAVALFAAGLFVCCMICHGELARRKPAAGSLTAYYLTIASGGAVGSLLVSLVAPKTASWQVELPASLIACAVLAIQVLYRSGSRRGLVLRAAILLAFVLLAGGTLRERAYGALVMARNFYGSLTLSEYDASNPRHWKRALYHGSIVHGVELLGLDLRREPTAYYGRSSGIGIALDRRVRASRSVGVVGLGVGTLAAYARPGDSFVFYEINPLVAALAKSHFFFLDPPPAETRFDVRTGDARLTLERQAAQSFDVLAIDAFAGDSIPAHLLTREAFTLYFRNLKPDGILAVHISNKYVNFEPLLARAAVDLGKEAVLVRSKADPNREIFAAEWVLMASGRDPLREINPSPAESLPPPAPDFRMWTDDYSNVWSMMR